MPCQINQFGGFLDATHCAFSYGVFISAEGNHRSVVVSVATHIQDITTARSNGTGDFAHGSSIAPLAKICDTFNDLGHSSSSVKVG
jgi:hypothetical protein